MRTMTLLLMAATGALAAAAVVTAVAFRRDMAAAEARIAAVAAQAVDTPFGRLDFAQGGDGPPVLVIHGSGGGHDQGALLARAVLGEGWRWIAPSRFGYLGSALPPAGAGFAEQAQAYVHLLDHLGLQRVAVVALSHGGPSALLLAALHPERVSSLTLLSAGVVAVASADQQQSDRQGRALTWLFQRDWAYWALTHGLRGRFLALMGADAAVLDGLPPDRLALVDALIEGMSPVSRRAAGVVLDNRAAMPTVAQIATIRAPTLIVHARDDTLQRFHHAEVAAGTIPGARLAAIDRGGHLVVAVEVERVRALLAGHLRAGFEGSLPSR